MREHREDVAGARIPDAGRIVDGGRDHHTSVRAPGGPGDLAHVPDELQPLLAARCIPDLRALPRDRRENALPGRIELRGGWRVGIAKLGLLRSGEVPDP